MSGFQEWLEGCNKVEGKSWVEVFAEGLTVRNRMELMPFVANEAQRELEWELGQGLGSGYVVMKDRQQGLSEWLAVRMLALAVTTPGYEGYYAGFRSELSELQQVKVRRYWEMLREKFGSEFPWIEQGKAGSLKFSNGSRLRFGFARTEEISGYPVHDLYVDELGMFSVNQVEVISAALMRKVERTTLVTLGWGAPLDMRNRETRRLMRLLRPVYLMGL